MMTYEQLAGIRRMVAIGDSITFGCSALDQDGKWVELLARMIERSFRTKLTVKNQGICGNILSVDSPAYSVSSMPCGLERVDQDIVEENPDLVVIAYGLNDSRGGTALETFRADYQTMIDRIRSRIHPIIVAVNLTYMHPTFYADCAPWDHSDLALAARFNEAIRELAEKNDLIYADVFSVLQGLDCTVCDDRCHPNDLGHQLMAGKIFDSMIQALR